MHHRARLAPEPGDDGPAPPPPRPPAARYPGPPADRTVLARFMRGELACVCIALERVDGEVFVLIEGEARDARHAPWQCDEEQHVAFEAHELPAVAAALARAHRATRGQRDRWAPPLRLGFPRRSYGLPR